MSGPGASVARLSAMVQAVPASVQNRLVGLALAAPTGVVLGIARALTPDPAGVGTHRQLGLGGCALLTFAGVPCPMCGMTTTFTHLAHLHLWAGFVNQPFGLVLFSLTLGAFGLGLIDLVTGKGQWRQVLRSIGRWETPIALSLMIGLVLGWTYKIAVMRIFW